jgi:glucan 1,3-beta-glucosidase
VSDYQVNLFYSPDNIRKTISVLQFLTDALIDVPNVVGVQMLNEPVNVPELWDFYNTALNSLRGSSTKAQKFPFYFHDAFDVDRGVDFMKIEATNGMSSTIILVSRVIPLLTTPFM